MQILPTSAKSSIQPTPEIQVKPPTTQAFEAPPFPNTTADGRPPSTKPPATSLPTYQLQNLEQIAGRTTLVSTRLSRLLRDNGLSTETPKLDSAAVDFAKAARRHYFEPSDDARLVYHSAADALFAVEDRLWTALETKRSHGFTSESGGPVGAEALLSRFMRSLSAYFPPE